MIEKIHNYFTQYKKCFLNFNNKCKYLQRKNKIIIIYNSNNNNNKKIAYHYNELIILYILNIYF